MWRSTARRPHHVISGLTTRSPRSDIDDCFASAYTHADKARERLMSHCRSGAQEGEHEDIVF